MLIGQVAPKIIDGNLARLLEAGEEIFRVRNPFTLPCGSRLKGLAAARRRVLLVKAERMLSPSNPPPHYCVVHSIPQPLPCEHHRPGHLSYHVTCLRPAGLERS